MPRLASKIILSDPDREELELIASRPKSSQREAQRARIILACADEKMNIEVADMLEICKQTVGK